MKIRFKQNLYKIKREFIDEGKIEFRKLNLADLAVLRE